jgi:hypothetical protein
MPAYEVRRLLIPKLPGDKALRGAAAEQAAKVNQLSRSGFRIAHVSEVVGQRAGMHYEFWMEREIADGEELPALAKVEAEAGPQSEEFQAKVAAKAEATRQKMLKQQEMMARIAEDPRSAEEQLAAMLLAQENGGTQREVRPTDDEVDDEDEVPEEMTLRDASAMLGMEHAAFQNRVSSRKLKKADDWPFELEPDPRTNRNRYIGDTPDVLPWLATHFEGVSVSG